MADEKRRFSRLIAAYYLGGSATGMNDADVRRRLDDLEERFPDSFDFVLGNMSSTNLQFPGLVNTIYKQALIVAERWSTNDSFVAIASYYNNAVNVSVVHNNNFTYDVNSAGTVAVKHSSNNGGVRGFAIVWEQPEQ